jgi:hypothetical protein
MRAKRAREIRRLAHRLDPERKVYPSLYRRLKAWYKLHRGWPKRLRIRSGTI